LGFCSSSKAYTYSDYEAAFVNFTQSMNHWMPIQASKDLAFKNWDVAGGNWKIAVRLASKENHESGHFKLAAWIDPLAPPDKQWPRYDALGSHLNLLVQQARRLNITTAVMKNPYSDEMDDLKERCAKDPAFGTWIVAHAYVDKVNQVGLDRASHWWQTGKTWFLDREEYENDGYLKSIHQGERLFYTMIPGVPRKVAPIKSRRNSK
jgi:hypothetical protein